MSKIINKDYTLSPKEIESIITFCEKLEEEQKIEEARNSDDCDFIDVWTCKFSDVEFCNRIWEIEIRIVNFNSSSSRAAPYRVSAKVQSELFETVMGQKYYFNDISINPDCTSLNSAKRVAKRYFHYVKDRFKWFHHIEIKDK